MIRSLLEVRVLEVCVRRPPRPARAQFGIPPIPGIAIGSTLLRSDPVSQVTSTLSFTTIDGGPGQGTYLLF